MYILFILQFEGPQGVWASMLGPIQPKSTNGNHTVKSCVGKLS